MYEISITNMHSEKLFIKVIDFTRGSISVYLSYRVKKKDMCYVFLIWIYAYDEIQLNRFIGLAMKDRQTKLLSNL